MLFMKILSPLSYTNIRNFCAYPKGFFPKVDIWSMYHCPLLAQLAGACGIPYVASMNLCDLLLRKIKKENACMCELNFQLNNLPFPLITIPWVLLTNMACNVMLNIKYIHSPNKLQDKRYAVIVYWQYFLH